MKLSIFPWLLLGILLNTGAQLLLKAGSERISGLTFSWANATPMVLEVAKSPAILTGLFFYGLSVLIWIGVLSRVEVSVAYPMLSLGYVVNAIAAYYLFGEALSVTRFTGMGFILLGVYLIARS